MQDIEIDYLSGSPDKRRQLILETGKENSGKGQGDTRNTLMSVAEMRELLGLKRTDSYWLVHKGFFETKQLLGKMWIDRVSFEKWYANQVKYHKVTGEEPGVELKARSYSVRDAAQMLGIHEATFYAVIKRDHIETFLVDHWMRISREVFERWYARQDQYAIRQESVPEESGAGSDDWKPETDILDVVAVVPDRKSQYLTIKEAAQAADVTRATISCWIRDRRLGVKRIGRKAYIPVQELAEKTGNRYSTRKKEKVDDGINSEKK